MCVGGGLLVHFLGLDFRICPPFVTLHNGMNLLKLFSLHADELIICKLGLFRK